MPKLFHQLLTQHLASSDQRLALIHQAKRWTYSELHHHVLNTAGRLSNSGLTAGDRVVIYLPKCLEAVASLFAASLCGAVFVPVSPQLKAHQVQHIIDDCGATLLITNRARQEQLNSVGVTTRALVTDAASDAVESTKFWEASTSSFAPSHKGEPHELAALLYTSGSTGQPKGIMLSHENLCLGAKSVADYLELTASDRVLAVLPFSFDYGLSQLTSQFLMGGSVVMLDYLLPGDVIKQLISHQATGLAAVPPLWSKLADLTWPERHRLKLRFITNSGGHLDRVTIEKLKLCIPDTQIFLMYGLTEAFRSTYLSPTLVDKKIDSIGQAIPHAQVFVLRPDGSECDPLEHGELVHTGPLVSGGYWHNPQATAEKFRPLPKDLSQSNSESEVAVWSGDIVYRDHDGDLYFVSRADFLIKSSGYRISPEEIEAVVRTFDGVAEVVATGLSDRQLGQKVVLALVVNEHFEAKTFRRQCQQRLAGYMQPSEYYLTSELPINANGKFDRQAIYSWLLQQSQAKTAGQ